MLDRTVKGKVKAQRVERTDECEESRREDLRKSCENGNVGGLMMYNIVWMNVMSICPALKAENHSNAFDVLSLRKTEKKRKKKKK